jgi:hypothetical protein
MDAYFPEKKSDNLKHSSMKILLQLAFFFSVLIISIGFISAVQIDMKDNFSQSETLIAKISGNFIDAPSSSGILFYRDYVRVPTQFNLSKIGDDYYLYAVLSNKIAGNYSMWIKNVRYMVGTEMKDDDIIRNFTISNATADFYVVPGFLKASDDFSLELTNLQDYSVEVRATLENAPESPGGFLESLFGASGSETEQTLEISSGGTKKAYFNFDSNLNESGFENVLLESENTSYSVPVYMDMGNRTAEKGTGAIEFEPSILNVSMATGSNATRVIYLYNRGNLSADNISVYVSDELAPYINVSAPDIDEIEGNSSMKIELLISSAEDEDNIEGQITAQYENETDGSGIYVRSSIFLDFIKDYVPSAGENVTVIDTKTCSEIGGAVCASGEECSGESVYAQDSKCCLDTCEAVQQSSLGKYIGWGLVVLVLAFLAWFFMKKYRKVKPSVDLLKVAEKK